MAEESVTISLANVASDARLAQLTRDLSRDLSRAGMHPRTADMPAEAGQRGEPITLGVIALALITHGAVTALLECLKAYISRERGLIVKVTRPDGTQIEVSAHNVDTASVRDALAATAAPLSVGKQSH